MAVSPAVRRYLAQLDKVSNPKVPCKRVPSKYIGKQASIRGKLVRGLACSDVPKHIWGDVGGEERDIPVSMLAGKAHRSDGRAVRRMKEKLKVEFVEGRKSKKKRPAVKRFSGFGRKGTGRGPARYTEFMKSPSDLPRGQKGKARKLAYRMNEKQIAASRKGAKGSPIRRADLLRMNAERYAALTGKSLTDRRRSLTSRDAAGFIALYESRAAAIASKAEKKSKKLPSEIKGAPEVSDTSVVKAAEVLSPTEVKAVEDLADTLVSKGASENEIEKLGRLMIVELSKIPDREGRMAAFSQLRKTFITALELPKLGRPRGSKNAPKSSKLMKATTEVMAKEVKEVTSSLGTVSNPYHRMNPRHAMNPRHLIRF